MSRDPRRTLKIALGILFSLIIVIYAIDKTKNLLIGPQITIISPQNGISIKESTIPIEGKTRNIVKIFINGKQIPVLESGFFQDQLVLLGGYNIISVTGEDRFGKIKKVELEIIREKEN